jgi:hypothetical protein
MSCGNLQSIQPKEVLEQVDKVWLGERLTAGRTLVDHKRLAKIRDCILQTNHLRGDIAELGTYMGGVAKMMGHYAPDATLHIFDTFTGIPEDDSHGEHKKGDFPSNADDVKKYLDNPKAVLHVGMFPDTAPQDVQRYRMVHIDGDTYQTTRAAIIYFSDLMVKGGIMVWDDYTWYRTSGVAKALHEAFSPERIERGNGFQAVVRF